MPRMEGVQMALPEPCYLWYVRSPPLVGFQCQECGETFPERPTYADTVRRVRVWRALTRIDTRTGRTNGRKTPQVT
jgi:hypothetical protein